jgi:hypothetical protein
MVTYLQNWRTQMSENQDDIEDCYEWVIVHDKVPLPEFIAARAKGEMKMEGGRIYRKALIGMRITWMRMTNP